MNQEEKDILNGLVEKCGYCDILEQMLVIAADRHETDWDVVIEHLTRAMYAVPPE